MAAGLSHPKVTLYIGDGFEFMKNHHNEFDVIIADISDPEGILLIPQIVLLLDMGNRIVFRDPVRTATAIAAYNFRIAFFSYAKHSSSAEETNRVQNAVCLFSLRFTLGLNFIIHVVTVQCMNLFTKHFSDYF